MARPGLAAVVLLAVGCGGGPAGPGPAPATGSLHPVSGFVFYDENDSGRVDPGEATRLAGVALRIGGRTAVTGADGRFLASDVPAGTNRLELDPASLPPYWRPGSLTSITVPSAEAEVAVPVALPIGGNRPHVYMAFGDSITAGEGSRGREGYRRALADRLRALWGRAEVVDEGVPQTRSDEGAERVGDSLVRVQPAYTLILYGTNDWNDEVCRGDPASCFTVPSLRAMIRATRAAGSLPVVATLPPINPLNTGPQPGERGPWVTAMNGLIRTLVREEGAVLADLATAMMQESPGLIDLYNDALHPNDRGYSVIARELFRTITAPRGAAAAGSGARLTSPAPGPVSGGTRPAKEPRPPRSASRR